MNAPESTSPSNVYSPNSSGRYNIRRRFLSTMVECRGMYVSPSFSAMYFLIELSETGIHSAYSFCWSFLALCRFLVAIACQSSVGVPLHSVVVSLLCSVDPLLNTPSQLLFPRSAGAA